MRIFFFALKHSQAQEYLHYHQSLSSTYSIIIRNLFASFVNSVFMIGILWEFVWESEELKKKDMCIYIWIYVYKSRLLYSQSLEIMEIIKIMQNILILCFIIKLWQHIWRAYFKVSSNNTKIFARGIFEECLACAFLFGVPICFIF